MEETLGISGHVVLVLLGSDGKEKDRREIKNLVVGAGLGHIASRLTGTAQAVMSHMAIGTDSTAAASANTALGAEVGRVALTSTTLGGAYSQNLTYAATFGAGVGTGNLREAAILNNSSGGTMLCRTVFPLITKGAGDTLQVTWTVNLTAS